MNHMISFDEVTSLSKLQIERLYLAGYTVNNNKQQLSLFPGTINILTRGIKTTTNNIQMSSLKSH